MKTLSALTLILLLRLLLPGSTAAQPFLHPGIDQTSRDLAWMKQQVLKGEQPWKGAFDRLKASTDTNFNVKAYTHVLRGPFGKPNIGGDDLSYGASMAYNCALVWYITQNKTYANKAIEILNAWSPVLWDFDYNDAKLLAAWTGHVLCNAAEILRYSNSGWQQQDIDMFSNMMLTVYYPLIRFYYPQANGNWDGAIIHSIMAMAIFTDNRAMFNNAVNHFLHGTVNGGIFKYLYPGGQCQESTRDQGHVQLGLGEFAGAAQVAYTQGVDLFSIGDNRIALGFEYTAGFILGSKPQCYGIISPRAKNLRDDYEYVYNHYSSRGVELPFVKKAADSMRLKAGRSVLTATRAPSGLPAPAMLPLKQSGIGYVAGAGAAAVAGFPANAIIVLPEQSIQQALDAAAGSGRWVVLKAGIHKIPASLRIPSSVTLAGEGLATVIFLDPASGGRDAIVNADNDMHDITIRDLVIEGAVKTTTDDDPNGSRSYRNAGNRGGIIFRALKEGDMKHISFANLTVQNCTFDGVLVSGATGISITRCNFDENGSSVIPGPRLQHNLLLTHCSAIEIKYSRLDTSPYGSGLALDHCSRAMVTNNEIARNACHGVLVSESKNITVQGNLVEANDRAGIMLEFLYYGTKNITVSNNIIHYNGGYGVEAYASKNSRVEGNTYAGNGLVNEQQKISNDKVIVME
jgi:parallel beta-helix repeat protein